jgi:SPP1 family holin
MKADKATIVRTILMVIAVLNTLLRAAGLDTLPFTGEEVGTVITAGYDAIITLWVWWKNQSFTTGAITGDQIMKRVKSGELSLDEIKQVLNSGGATDE